MKRGREECLHIDSEDEKSEKLEKSEGEDDEMDDDFAELQIDSDEDSEWDLSLTFIIGDLEILHKTFFLAKKA